MALSKSLTDREYQKFKENSLGETAVNVIAESSVPGVVLPAGFERVNSFSRITSVPASTVSTVLTYVVPVDRVTYLTKIILSGTNKATYTIKLDDSSIAELVTYYTHLNGSLDFGVYGLQLNAGEILTVEVEHVRTDLGDFSATIVGIKQEL